MIIPKVPGTTFVWGNVGKYTVVYGYGWCLKKGHDSTYEVVKGWFSLDHDLASNVRLPLLEEYL